jgi:SOS-response transcriptional repressor LexA
MSIFSKTACIDNKKETFGERLELAIKTKGVSKLWLADKIGISKQALHYLINHSNKPKYIDKISELLNIDPNWLEFGKQSTIQNQSLSTTKQHIKIYNSESLLNFILHKEQSNEGEFTYFQCPGVENIIAFRLQNDSLFPPLIENSLLFFDTQKKPNNGDYILILLNNSILVRQFVAEGSDIYYHATNNKYQSFTNVKVEIIGVLIEARYSMQ